MYDICRPAVCHSTTAAVRTTLDSVPFSVLLRALLLCGLRQSALVHDDGSGQSFAYTRCTLAVLIV